MRNLIPIILFAILMTAIQAVAEVTVIRTYPENGAKNVDPNTGYIRIRFSQPVDPRGYSFVNTDLGEPVQFTGSPRFEDGNTLCIIPAEFQPQTTYAVSINNERSNNFRSAADPNIPVTPYLLKFTTSGKPVKNTSKSTMSEWQEDLAYLEEELPRRHINLFSKITKDKWMEEVRLLNTRIPSMNKADIIVGLMKLVASVGDMHTTINTSAVYNPSVLPAALYWYKDGIYVVAASEEYENILGFKLQKINGMEIGKACETVSSVFASDNEYTKRQTAPNLLVIPEILKALKIVQNADRITLTLQDNQGSSSEVTIDAVKSDSNVRLVQAFKEAKTPLPLYRKYPNKNYWAEYVEKDNLIFFQYNQCSDTANYPFASMRSDLEKLLSEHKDARLVIDLRRNSGGNSSILDPFIDSLKDNPDVNQKGKLFVITGRYTFSSAILNAVRLRNETKAIFYGEPTACSVNHFGEVKAFQLPRSKMTVFYSTKYFKHSEKDEKSLMPDMVVEQTFSDYVNGIDPVLDAISRWKPM